tara:strand:- start:117543 stop:118181 length:639 start_codon:yes stop_codon:yes gene_type:complete
MEKILVIGANGNTGSRIVEQLLKADNYSPVAMVRKEHQKDKFENMGSLVCVGDLEEDFSSCFEGIDKVIFAAGSGSNTGNDKTEAVDRDGAIKAIDLSVDSGISKFVMLSSMGTDIPDQVPGLENYLIAKKEADDHLKSSGLCYSIIQPGGLTNTAGNGKVEVAKKLNKFGKITRDDVAETLIECLELDTAKNTTFELLDGEVEITEALKTL